MHAQGCACAYVTACALLCLLCYCYYCCCCCFILRALVSIRVAGDGDDAGGCGGYSTIVGGTPSSPQSPQFTMRGHAVARRQLPALLPASLEQPASHMRTAVAAVALKHRPRRISFWWVAWVPWFTCVRAVVRVCKHACMRACKCAGVRGGHAGGGGAGRLEVVWQQRGVYCMWCWCVGGVTWRHVT